MKLLRRTLVVLAGLLLTGSACRAQDFGFVWSEWERSAVERRGPERAEGLLLYFHGFGVQHAYLHPIPPIFTEMAKVAACGSTDCLLPIVRRNTTTFSALWQAHRRSTPEWIQENYRRRIFARRLARSIGSDTAGRQCGDRLGAWNGKLRASGDGANARRAGAETGGRQGEVRCGFLLRGRPRRGPERTPCGRRTPRLAK
jgi:hypothetical protein